MRGTEERNKVEVYRKSCVRLRGWVRPREKRDRLSEVKRLGER